MAPVAGTPGKVLARISPEVLAAKRCYESGQNPTPLVACTKCLTIILNIYYNDL